MDCNSMKRNCRRRTIGVWFGEGTTMVGDKPPRTVTTTIMGARITRMGSISSSPIWLQY
ncbi:hypothetical protein HanPSC8_Chr05g0202151 [Helianthus annuus]|nr:hypothetical protein HanPSC8_Chr05g0202151 [Helianthus annuus]